MVDLNTLCVLGDDMALLIYFNHRKERSCIGNALPAKVNEPGLLSRNFISQNGGWNSYVGFYVHNRQGLSSLLVRI